MSCKTSQTLREKRAKLVHDARQIKSRAEAEKRSLTTEEADEFKKLIAAQQEFVDKITAAEAEERSEEEEALAEQRMAEQEQAALEEEERMLEEADKQLEEAERSLRRPQRRRTTPGRLASTDPSRNGQRLATPDRPNAHRGTPEYRSLFRSYLLHGQAAFQSAEARSVQVDSDVLGGYLAAPQQMLDQLIQAMDEQLMMLQLATVHPLTEARSLGVPAIDTDPSDAEWVSELSTGTEDTAMRFGKRSLTPHKLSKRIKISNDLIRYAPNAEQIVNQRLAYKFDVTLEQAFMTGDGADKPLGVFTASPNGISTSRDIATGNTSTSIQVDGLYNAVYSLKQGYRKSKSLRWLFHANAVKQIMTLKDGEGRYIWQPSAQVGQPDMLLGFPVWESAYAPNTFATGMYVGMIADFAYYWIARVQDLAIQRLVELYAETDETGLIGRMHLDGMPALEEAFARVKLG